jgi:drug/metabolite transporter (DMT)-like permease
MPRSRTTQIRTRLDTYTGYGIGCAVVWAVILVVAQRRLDRQRRNTLRLVCGGWWMGWTSATIARVGYPPPEKLKPETGKRLGIVSIVLIAVGLLSVIRLLATGKRPASSAAGASGQ